MNKDELKAAVTAQIQRSWPEFEAAHPALAQLIDQTILSDQVMVSLASDTEFQLAYERAVSARVGAQVFTEMITRFVTCSLRTLL